MISSSRLKESGVKYRAEFASFNAYFLDSIKGIKDIVLNNAGAEAISINNERIINMSDIVDINLNDYEWFIKVNGQRILAPYEIKAIGNQTYLESALLGNGGYVDELKKQERNISIEKVNNIKITKYNDEIKTKYIE